ncbi:MAG: hypothetical protein HYX34_02485, partial [Actinobacteria bacterium]|nr:hypothetical protein [Actinomycetota bacterium]
MESDVYYGDGTLKQQTFTKPGLAAITTKYWVNSRGWRTQMSDTVAGGSARLTSYGYDRGGQVTSLTAQTGTISYGRDLVGTVVDLAYPDGAQARYTHDKVGRIAQMSVRGSPSGTFLPFAQYTYDDDG